MLTTVTYLRTIAGKFLERKQMEYYKNFWRNIQQFFTVTTVFQLVVPWQHSGSFSARLWLSAERISGLPNRNIHIELSFLSAIFELINKDHNVNTSFETVSIVFMRTF